MQPNYTKRIIAVIFAIAIVAVGVAVFVNSRKEAPVEVPVVDTFGPKHSVIGKSVQGRDIDAYVYGSGDQKILFVGGIHGGYEWNSVILARTFMDHISENPDIISSNVTVSVIPSANPDGVFKVIGKEGRFVVADASTTEEVRATGRFNANKVDLNRNFDCKWQPKSTWKTMEVSAGKAAFSEPEAVALRDYIASYKPSAVVFWHSKSNAVYASQCEKGILPGTLEIMNVYAKASGYPAVKTFDAYVTTGAADDWLASIGIPAITVELETHNTIEWAKNLAGVKAILELYQSK